MFVAAEGVDEVRSRIMPVNRKYPLRCYSKLAITKTRKKRSMMFDYILIAGVTSRDFRQLAGLLVGVVGLKFFLPRARGA